MVEKTDMSKMTAKELCNLGICISLGEARKLLKGMSSEQLKRLLDGRRRLRKLERQMRQKR